MRLLATSQGKSTHTHCIIGAAATKSLRGSKRQLSVPSSPARLYDYAYLSVMSSLPASFVCVFDLIQYVTSPRYIKITKLNITTYEQQSLSLAI